jgi:hypothetical protein
MLLDNDTTASPSSRRKSRRETIATEGHEDEEEEEVAESAGNTSRNRQSLASRRSTNQNNDGDDDDEDGEALQDTNQSYDYDSGPMDDGGVDDLDEEQAEVEMNLDGDENEDEGGNGAEEEDEDTGEETAVERPAPKGKRAKADKVVKSKSKARPRSRSRQREDSSESSASPIKRARISGFPLLDGELQLARNCVVQADWTEDDETEYTGDFRCRRSGRSHIKPLKWWLGDHIEYQPGEYLAEVKEVVRKVDEKRPPLAARRRITKKPSKPTDGSGFDRNTSQFGVVWDFPTASEDENRRKLLLYLSCVGTC